MSRIRARTHPGLSGSASCSTPKRGFFHSKCTTSGRRGRCCSTARRLSRSRSPKTRRAAIRATTSATRRVVGLRLSNGRRVVGTVRVYRPEGRNRLSDWARHPEHFRYVETGETTLHRQRRARYRSRARYPQRERTRRIDALFHAMCADGRVRPASLGRLAADHPQGRPAAAARRRGRRRWSTGDLAALLEPIMPEQNRKRVRRSGTTPTSPTRSPAWRGSAPTSFCRSQRARRRVPRHPDQDPHRRAARPVAAHPAALPAEQRAGARHRADRVRQVDDALRDDRLHQPDAHDHIITIEDPIEFVHENQKCLINQREVRHAHRLVQGRAARGAARRSRHRPRRRAARPRDGGDRDRDRRDRATSCSARCTRRRRRRRSIASSISSRPIGRRRSASCCRSRCGASSRRRCAGRSAAAASRRSRC